MQKSHRMRAGALAAVGVLALSACGSSDSSGSSSSGGFEAPDVPMVKSLGENEGSVSILAWPGYAEDGSNDPAYDWVTPFEQETGCEATVKYFGSSDEALNLMKTGDYDVVSASGDATLRLIAGGYVQPVNTDLLENYGDIQSFLKDTDYNSVDGQMYGMPQGWGANLLTWNPDVVTTAPTSWADMFDADSPYAGKISAYDSPIYIADAALVLMQTKPELEITNPYALDQDQFDAAVSLLKTQRKVVGEYWSDYAAQQQAFEKGDDVLGTSWQVIVNLVDADKKPIQSIVPEEGATGWSDTWMINAKSEHPNCAYAWLDYIGGPEGNAASAYYFGEAPANAKACDTIATVDDDATFCDTFHASDEAYAKKIWYWTTPISDCLDGRDTECVPYSEWAKAWTEIKG
ncbi:MAG: ABC transporter substrate-binding protein [Nocardioides sp.]|uniref:ABC transporter substrate-binding protein n=1 Tax=Nocardioides sp. TaxID=35761 RepID=UPI0039E5AAF3